MAKTTNSDNQLEITTWFGISIDKWVQLFQSIGFPTALVMFLLWMAWCYVPPIVDGHLQLLERTGDTLESMDKTLQQSNAILGKVSDASRETRIFMQTVQDTHSGQDQKLDTIIEQTKPK